MAVDTPVAPPSTTADARQRNLPALTTFAVGFLGVLYRVVMLARDVPPTNSDEATMGLAALHIANGQEFPAFFYGQHYMGTFEAYVAAPLVAIFGPSVTAIRMPNILLYAGFLIIMWQLTRRLYTPWFATFAIALLALGSDRILKNQLIAAGGYPEMNPAGALLILLSLVLASGSVRHRSAAYGAWGLVAGLIIWIDWLVIPYVAAAGVLLLCRARGLRGRAGLILATGALLGALPLIAHDIASGESSVLVFLHLNSGGADAAWPDRLFGGVLLGLPMGMGMCDPSHCADWQFWWGIAMLAMLAAAGHAAVKAVRQSRDEQRTVHAARLGLIIAAILSLIMYARSPAAGSTPIESARYLSCLLISLPAVLWPLWHASQTLRTGEVSTRMRRIGATAILGATALTALIASVNLVGATPTIQQKAEDRKELIATLRQMDVNRLYSDYWTCNNITFATDEKIVCAVLGDDLRPGLDRYQPYREAVTTAERPAYVFTSGSAPSRAIRQRIMAVKEVAVISVAGYDIYLPATMIALPQR